MQGRPQARASIRGVRQRSYAGAGTIGSPRRRTSPQPRTLVLSALITLTAATGCGGSGPGHTVTAAPLRLKAAPVHHPLRAPGATIAFLTPTPGAHVPGTLTVRVRTSDFHLLRLSTRPVRPRAGTGYLHFILDGGRLDQPRYSGPNGHLALTLGVNGFYSPADHPTITYQHLPPGPHILTAQLVNTDQTPTGISATIHFVSR